MSSYSYIPDFNCGKIVEKAMAMYTGKIIQASLRVLELCYKMLWKLNSRSSASSLLVCD
jgi:CO dehydrogenase/acetyl-CoA synthase gamma subunit (corrinoid Fe-S protein)